MFSTPHRLTPAAAASSRDRNSSSSSSDRRPSPHVQPRGAPRYSTVVKAASSTTYPNKAPRNDVINASPAAASSSRHPAVEHQDDDDDEEEEGEQQLGGEFDEEDEDQFNADSSTKKRGRAKSVRNWSPLENCCMIRIITDVQAYLPKAEKSVWNDVAVKHHKAMGEDSSHRSADSIRKHFHLM